MIDSLLRVVSDQLLVSRLTGQSQYLKFPITAFGPYGLVPRFAWAFGAFIALEMMPTGQALAATSELCTCLGSRDSNPTGDECPSGYWAHPA